MRVLIVDGGDRTPYLSRLVARLAASGLTMHYAADPAYKDFAALERDKVSCHGIEIRSKLDFRARRRIRRLLREHKIDILHTMTGRDAYVGMRARGFFKRKDLRLIVRRGAYPRFDPLDRWLYGRLGADVIIAVSEDLRRFMIGKGVPESRVTAVYTGIWSEELKAERRDLRKEHGVKPDAVLLGVAGALRWVKGFDDLLAAMRILKERKVPVHLLVAGDGYEGVRGQAEGLDVTFVGHLPGILGFTPNLDCLVVPSRLDALPRVAIEATVLGTPVVATRVGGIPEILDDGRAGVLVRPGDPGDLAGALEGAAREPQRMRALADRALTRNRELFSLERCVARHKGIYGT
ncbi:MAG TPA: glycosyltransferase family 4 protein [Planctomycetota bacterium]|nr:glycosyltransferase family 4 protein [Planctomycetota bacterium]